MSIQTSLLFKKFDGLFTKYFLLKGSKEIGLSPPPPQKKKIIYFQLKLRSYFTDFKNSNSFEKKKHLAMTRFFLQIMITFFLGGGEGEMTFLLNPLYCYGLGCVKKKFDFLY